MKNIWNRFFTEYCKMFEKAPNLVSFPAFLFSLFFGLALVTMIFAILALLVIYTNGWALVLLIVISGYCFYKQFNWKYIFYGK